MFRGNRTIVVPLSDRSSEEPTRAAGSGRMVVAALVGLLVMTSTVGVVVLASGTARAASPFRSLRIGELGLQILTLNPLRITYVDEFVVVYNTYSTLVTWDKDYHAIPDLAYDWTVAPDNVTWTFHLVHSASFLDPSNPGDRSHPVTAADVVFSYELEMSTPGSVFYSYVTELASVSALDTYTVQIVTRAPFAAMYSTLTQVPILPQYIWAGISNPLNYRPSYPVGSGAMYYDYANASATMLVFRRSPSYYGPQYYCRQVRPDEVRFIGYSSGGSLVNEFVSGANNLDAIEGIDPASYVTVLNSWSPKWAVNEGLVAEVSVDVMTDAERVGLIDAGYTQFKTGSNSQILATDLAVRQAIAMSVNKTLLLEDAVLGLGTVADSLVPASSPWHYDIPANEEFPSDPSAARALLNSEGWTYDASGNLNPDATPLYKQGATNPLIFRFYVLDEDWRNKAAADIVVWLNEAGIETTDAHGNIGFGSYSHAQMNGFWISADYDIWLWDWTFFPGSDPSLDILSVETTMAIGTSSDNFYTNPTYDGLYNESLVAMDPSARKNLTDAMQDMIYHDASYILPFYKDNLFAAMDGARWTNWGDWSRDVGLAPDSDLPNLWFQVEPVDNRAPSISAFPAAVGQNGTATSLSVVANDPEGDALNFTWTFGDGSPSAVTTTSTVDHVYASPGSYGVDVRVSDGEWFACASSTADIYPYAPGENLPPSLTEIQATFPFSLLNGTPFGVVNLPVLFALYVQDPEGDYVFLTWNWGDGGTTVQMMEGTASPQLALLAHLYEVPGTYVVTVVGSDNRTGTGNHTITKMVSGVLILADAPPVTFASVSGQQGLNGWYRSSVLVSLSATDDLTGVVATAYSLDGAPAELYTAPFSVSGDGMHALVYASIDGALNIEANQTLAVKIDTLPPVASGAISPAVGPAGWYTSPTTVAISATDPTSGVASIEYSLDSGAWTRYTGPVALPDGTHTLQYRATDVAGNTASVQSLSAKVDATPPAVDIVSPAARVTTASVALSWVGSDSGSGIASFAVRVDGGAFLDVGTNRSLELTLPDGTHTITVRATDAAGNVATRTTTVTVDTNLFSFTGPYGGLPTVAIVVVAAVLAVLVWVWRRRKSPRPPAGPPGPVNP